MKSLKFILLSAILASSSFALDLSGNFDPKGNSNRNNQREQQRDQNGNPLPMVSKEFPVDTNQARTKFSSPELLRDRFELDLSTNVAKNIIQKSDRYTKALSQTLDVNLLVDASVRQIKTTDSIYIHPHFLTTIAFPPKTEIIYMKSSIPLDTFNYSSNLLLIQPTKDFINGNILVTYRDDKRTYYTNIIIQKYDQVVFKDEYFNKYVIDDNYLSLNYQYVSNINFSSIDVLKKYFQLNGEGAIAGFKKDGDYDVILLGGVSYYIIRDNAFGEIDFRNMRFSVAQNYAYGDKSMLAKKVGGFNDFYPDERRKK
ncbi:hypothetical protein [Campylobacter sp. JMF_03 NE3]|uniref:hypothetical protein n=1 Tax=Campylobacter sp. JMF_03 NE3 TaxID=2983831 RepID=UPI0022E9F01F|nr:hypothetical protein [Campylobacter sp. JMF_03 NE3]MDA3053532.1 hypothetical protein [Campylobacter sp. JMF_03 NE3]